MKKIALCIRSDSQEGISAAMATVERLTSKGCTVYLPFGDKQHIGDREGVLYMAEDVYSKSAECIIVFGGDGTIMRTAHSTELPILGVNLGRIGYIAELETYETHLLDELVNDNFVIDNRMRLSYSVERGGQVVFKDTSVVNDIVFSKGGYSVMPEIELVCNGELVGKYFADGLICASPTGSTAYSLSAGGSIVDTGMECFCVTQICPQSFYAKPLIFSGSSVLEFRKGKRGHGKLQLVTDGEFVTEIEEGDIVTIKKSPSNMKLIRIKKNNFYSVMRSKMTEI